MSGITIAKTGTMSITYNAPMGLTMGPQIINAGRWVISQSFHVCVTKKPCWLHRTMAKALLGWEWQNE
jgi:hypothetical protein